jgi:hypothetical protein
MPAWSVDVAGGTEILATPDGGVVVRTTRDPWFVSVSKDGQATPLSLQAGTPWAGGFALGKDGSLYVAGMNASSPRVDHLSPSGQLLGSNDLSAEATDILAIRHGSDDDNVYVLARLSGALRLLTLSAEGKAGTIAQLPGAAPDERGSMQDFASPHQFAVARGRLGLQGGDDLVWLADVTLPAAASMATAPGLGNWWHRQADEFAYFSVYAGGVSPAPNGGWYSAFGSGWTNASSGLGYYSRTLERYTASGKGLWTGFDYFEPRIVTDPAAQRLVTFATLADSVIYAGFLVPDPQNSDPSYANGSSPANVVRFSHSGLVGESLTVPNVLGLAPVGPTSVAMLTSGSVVRYDFEALNLPASKAGAKCVEATDCESGACCAGPRNMFQHVCLAEPKCGQGDSCSSDANCTGKCMLSATGPEGFCAGACAASADCPKDTFCVAGGCLPVCAMPQDCPYPGVACARVPNAEGIDVSVCQPR